MYSHRSIDCPLSLQLRLAIQQRSLWSPYYIEIRNYLKSPMVKNCYVIGQTIIFLPCDFYLLSSFFSFPRLISGSQRSEIGCLPYFHTWCGLSANLEYTSEMCCTRLAGNTGRKKIAILAPSHNFVAGCIFAAEACIDNRKKNLLNPDRLSPPHVLIIW